MTLLRIIREAARHEQLPNWSAAEYVCGWAGWPYDPTLIFRIRLIIRHEKIKEGRPDIYKPQKS